MKLSSRRFRTLVLTLAAPAAAFLAGAPSAHAGPLVASANDCASQELSQPFAPWLDPAHYTLAPNGGFEESPSSWDLRGGASPVSGNEPYYVRADGDSTSLRLPSGSSATSSAMCVGIEHPTLRLFARNSGSPLSTLKVEVHFEDAFGNVHSAPLGVVSSSGAWQPTLPMVLGVNLLPLLPGEHTPVAFQFTPRGEGGKWQIDDVYVDPYRRS
jgi:hypothetical protein